MNRKADHHLLEGDWQRFLWSAQGHSSIQESSLGQLLKQINV